MMRMLMTLALVATLGGCDDKGKETTPTTTTVAPTPTPTTTVAPTVSGAAVAPSGAAVAPTGAAVAPSGEAAKPDTHPGDKHVKAGAATKSVPSGAMPHGNPEDGTLKYNPPPSQSAPAKKDAAHL